MEEAFCVMGSKQGITDERGLFYTAISSGLVRRKRKTRIRDRTRHLPLRIFKNDIRRQYAQMFINVINNYDDNVISSFFRTYASPEVEIDKHCPYVTPLYSSVDIALQGIPQVALYWMAILKVVPDIVYDVENVRIVTSSESDECRIQCTVHATFSNFCMVAAPTIAMQIVKTHEWEHEIDDALATIQHNSKRDRHSTVGPLMSPFLETFGIRKLSYIVPFGTLERCNPWSMLVTSTMTMHVNAQKQITHFKYERPAFVY